MTAILRLIMLIMLLGSAAVAQGMAPVADGATRVAAAQQAADPCCDSDCDHAADPATGCAMMAGCGAGASLHPGQPAMLLDPRHSGTQAWRSADLADPPLAVLEARFQPPKA